MSTLEKVFGNLNQAKVPAELAAEDALLTHLEISPSELKKIWWYRRRMYHRFTIAKGKGQLRIISAPDQRLKFIQRKIAELLGTIYKRRNPVHGFVSDRSIKTNALSHIDSKFVLNLDIKDFFPSITEGRVRGVLIALGVDDRVAKVVARICTNNGSLPQGSPSSPILSNMICFRLDRDLLAVAKQARCIYTRYADDVTFSSYRPLSLLFEGAPPSPGVVPLDLLASNLRHSFNANGFAINPNKVHYADRNSRRMVTGLKINDGINVDRKYVRNIRSALYAVEKNGLAASQLIFKEKYHGTSSVYAHLHGKIAWLGHIKGRSDPVFRKIAKRFNSVFPDEAIIVEPTAIETRDRSVWVVEHERDNGTQGSAFFLKGVGLVTAAHCVENPINLEVYHPSKIANKFKVAVAKLSADHDLAILSHTIPSHEFYELDRSKHVVSVGQQLIAVGYPSFGPGDRINVRPGIVSSLPQKKGIQLIEVTQKLTQGMSGGPLIDGQNQVVGIVHKGGPDEGRDFAIDISVLNEWIGSS